MIAIAAVNSLVGFFREILLTRQFGSSPDTDSYFLALAIAQFFSACLAASVNTSFIPVLAQVDAEQKTGIRRFYSNVFNTVLLISFCLLGLAFIFIRPLIGLLTGQAANQELTVQLSRIAIIALLFPGVAGVLTGFLEYRTVVLPSVLIGLPFNAVFIFYLLFLSNRYGIRGLAWVGIAALASQLIVLIPSLRKEGFRLVGVLDPSDPPVRKMAWLSLPIIFATLAGELNVIIEKSVASRFPAGSITYLSYGRMVGNEFNVIIIYSLAIVLFPSMARAYSAGKPQKAHHLLLQTFRITLITTLPLTLIFFAFPELVIGILFERGEFTHHHTVMTASLLAMFGLGLPANSFRIVLNNSFYSRKNTLIPALGSLGLLLTNSLLIFYLRGKAGLAGIALASSIAGIMDTSALILIYQKQEGFRLLDRQLGLLLVKILAAATIGLGPLYWILGHTGESLSFFQRKSLFGIIILFFPPVYLLIGYLLGIPEIRILGKRFGRRNHPSDG